MEQKPYIIILDTGAYEDFLEGIEDIFDPEQIVMATDSCLESFAKGCSGWLGGLGELDNGDGLAAKVKPVLEEIARRGYLPTAILGCPFLTNALLEGTEQNLGLSAQGFCGRITLMLTLSEVEYRGALPTLFKQNIVDTVILEAGLESMARAIMSAIEGAGIKRIKPGFVNVIYHPNPDKTYFPPLGC